MGPPKRLVFTRSQWPCFSIDGHQCLEQNKSIFIINTMSLYKFIKNGVDIIIILI